MSKSSKHRNRHPLFQRAIAGVTLTCIVVVLIGGVINHARIEMIFFWAAIVGVVLSFMTRMSLQLWSTWEEVAQANELMRRKSHIPPAIKEETES